MTITIKAIAKYYDLEVDADTTAPGFDLEAWAREECKRASESFHPDEVEYLSYEIVE